MLSVIGAFGIFIHQYYNPPKRNPMPGKIDPPLLIVRYYDK